MFWRKETESVPEKEIGIYLYLFLLLLWIIFLQLLAGSKDVAGLKYTAILLPMFEVSGLSWCFVFHDNHCFIFLSFFFTYLLVWFFSFVLETLLLYCLYGLITFRVKRKKDRQCVKFLEKGSYGSVYLFSSVLYTAVKA